MCESISRFSSSVCNVYRQLLFPRSIYVKIKKKIKKAIIRVTYSNFVSYNVGIDGIDTTPIGCRDEFVRFVRKLRTFLSPWQWRFQSGPWNESSWSFEIFHFWFFQSSNTNITRSTSSTAFSLKKGKIESNFSISIHNSNRFFFSLWFLFSFFLL